MPKIQRSMEPIRNGSWSFTLTKNRNISLASEEDSILTWKAIRFDLLPWKKNVAPIADVRMSPLSESRTRFPPRAQRFQGKRNAYNRRSSLVHATPHSTINIHDPLCLCLCLWDSSDAVWGGVGGRNNRRVLVHEA